MKALWVVLSKAPKLNSQLFQGWQVVHSAIVGQSDGSKVHSIRTYRVTIYG